MSTKYKIIVFRNFCKKKIFNLKIVSFVYGSVRFNDKQYELIGFFILFDLLMQQFTLNRVKNKPE